VATCPKVVKCAGAALVALGVVFGMWYALHCRDIDALTESTKSLNAYVLDRGKMRDQDTKDIKGDIGQIKSSIVAIQKDIQYMTGRKGDDATAGMTAKGNSE
jgi:hypothetical protein